MKNVLLKLACITLIFISIRSFAANVSLVVLGDSLSAGYGLSQQQTWVAELQKRWQQAYPNIEIINASISGETTRGGLNRLSGVIERHQPDAIFIELGGNDGLRGFDLETVETNLSNMIEQAQAKGIKVALSQVMVPPNYGPRFSKRFQAVFTRVAEKYDVTLVPFFMTELVENPDFVQDDGIHPTAEAQDAIADFLSPYLLELAKNAEASS
ncbi:arylesterase [Idiomarina sp. UBA3162]|jgi:acyl-CoA thioesterase-1|uniref:arylesterase n=1 Tax=unclassified Idiomarina TaxID=2614829 RepID=UPI000C96F5AF|nr:arylesterase [Idiomarina sp. UBA3162]MAD52949.1 arylesterase [Idiomarinaceae bacterium]|tara:strand:- start:100 stop:735 length:636 start_codon:yes stop_codon:yes gene_type:complete